MIYFNKGNKIHLELAELQLIEEKEFKTIASVKKFLKDNKNDFEGMSLTYLEVFNYEL